MIHVGIRDSWVFLEIKAWHFVYQESFLFNWLVSPGIVLFQIDRSYFSHVASILIQISFSLLYSPCACPCLQIIIGERVRLSIGVCKSQQCWLVVIYSDLKQKSTITAAKRKHSWMHILKRTCHTLVESSLSLSHLV